MQDNPSVADLRPLVHLPPLEYLILEIQHKHFTKRCGWNGRAPKVKKSRLNKDN